MARRSPRSAGRQYPRTARVDELLRQIVAEALERVDDERLELCTVTAVHTEADLRHATVLYDALGGADDDEEVLAALAEHRIALQREIGRQARIKRVPMLAFEPDPAVRAGERIDAILRGLDDEGADADGSGPA